MEARKRKKYRTLEIGLVIKSEVVCWSTIFKIKLPRQSHILIILRSLNGYAPTKARELSNCIDNCRWILCRAACRRQVDSGG